MLETKTKKESDGHTIEDHDQLVLYDLPLRSLTPSSHLIQTPSDPSIVVKQCGLLQRSPHSKFLGLNSLCQLKCHECHDTGKEKNCLPQVGQWNMMNKVYNLRVHLHDADESDNKLDPMNLSDIRERFLNALEAEGQSQNTIKRISRKAMQGFNMIPYHLVNEDSEEEAIILNRRNGNYNSKDATLCYTLPIHGNGALNNKLFLTQRVNNVADISDLEFCNKHDIDNTGLWPSEDVLAYFCLSHADLFMIHFCFLTLLGSKRVIELGSGYGLAGLVIAAVTDATEVIISDGNPQDAEDDCTEALNMDDRYIKAYSRQATARKELGKLKECLEVDVFF
ncbi:hypothetical protein F8388_014246 [Cannabis sativa]|uniref:Calmodulin-lysine N-methyltransferase n=1 Tax=Cannabis sativa TaxID=3483 RepID=A0A7J6GQC0_CANSA|nr:hypothetical protein G4B88_031437 [Cannabis sativa]KAF4385113.1 hypothetical protein F8388_014246 [Cannabis sativa]